MRKYWSNIANQAEPYVPGEQPINRALIKLNTNENPYPPSPKVLKALQQAINGDLRLYPSPTAGDVRKTAAQIHNLSHDQVFMGNGSDEVLAFSFLAFFNPGQAIRVPDITYSFYPVYAKLYQLDYEQIPLNEDFSIPVEQFFNAPGGVVCANPNAPTGLFLPLGDVERIIQNNPDHVVIIDEAYVDFGGESSIGLIEKYDNLLVIQTLSKAYSLAGLRVGLAYGDQQLIQGLNRIKNSFNSYTIDRLALAGAQAALEAQEYLQQTRNKIVKTRTRIMDELKKLGFEMTDSKTNFLFIRHPNVTAQSIYENLKEQGIYIRYFNKPRISDYVRVTIGTDDEMDRFLTAVKGLLP